MLQVWREAAASAARQKQIRARAAKAARRDRLRVEVKVAEIAEAPSVAGHHAKPHVSGADLIARRASLRREHLQLKSPETGARAGGHLADRRAARHLLECGGPPRRAGLRDGREHHRRGGGGRTLGTPPVARPPAPGCPWRRARV